MPPAQPETPGPTDTRPAETPVEVEARRLLAVVPLPAGALEVQAQPGLTEPSDNFVCSPRTDLDRFWHVPDEAPDAVISGIAAQIRADEPRISTEISGAGGAGAVRKYSKAFQIQVSEPDVIHDEWLELGAVADEAGGTMLRVDAMVMPAGTKCGGSAPGLIG